MHGGHFPRTLILYHLHFCSLFCPMDPLVYNGSPTGSPIYHVPASFAPPPPHTHTHIVQIPRCTTGLVYNSESCPLWLTHLFFDLQMTSVNYQLTLDHVKQKSLVSTLTQIPKHASHSHTVAAKEMETISSPQKPARTDVVSAHGNL